MRILYIRLVNFIGIKAGMGVTDIEFDFSNMQKKIIQIYGQNRCGKTVLLHQLHPYSSINLNGDERNDLPLIIENEIGIKNIVYEIDDCVYNITHTYKPTTNGHSISSSIKKDGIELNSNGGVNTFNNIIYQIFGINKYSFQFLINGTQLTSFANMKATQRKSLLNKAMGIDIYDKIHKLATDDYRYTNKLITSLNNTKEYLLSTYGSYETLCEMINEKKSKLETISSSYTETKQLLDELNGKIDLLRQQNVNQEYSIVDQQYTSYMNIISIIGSYDDTMYDRLVEEQIQLNNQLNDFKLQYSSINKDIDILYSKKNDIQSTIEANRRAKEDYDNMKRTITDLENKIKEIKINEDVDYPPSTLYGLLSIAQTVNSICKEIVISLNDNLLQIFISLINNGDDISSFLAQQSSILLDSEKERDTISRIHDIISSVGGEHIKCDKNCVYKNTHKQLDVYFRSYQSSKENNYTTYDIDLIQQQNKNLNTIKTLINVQVVPQLTKDFNIINIVNNLNKYDYGINVTKIEYLIEEATNCEMKRRLISQLTDAKQTFDNMSSLLLSTNNTNNNDDIINELNNKINDLQTQLTSINTNISNINISIENNEKMRVNVSHIKNINISELTSKREKLLKMSLLLKEYEDKRFILSQQYNSLTNEVNQLNTELDTLDKANYQYVNTMKDIENQLIENNQFKVIAEATSSTKGKPVILIKDTVERAISLTNKIVKCIYTDDEIQLLRPTIDEDSFILPFRNGINKSPDLMYGSQSESAMLSMSLSLALGISLTKYNVVLLDEMDAYLDHDMKYGYYMMLDEMLTVLNLDQIFVISHGDVPNTYIDKLDIHKIINDQQ